MKQLTIRTKVTFWYAMIMVLMAASTLGLLLSVSETAHLSDQKSRLMETVEEAAEDISEDGEDVFDSFEDGVYLSLYDSQGTFLQGNIPSDFQKNLEFSEQSVYPIKANRQSFYVYDRKLSDGQWIRGIISESEFSHFQVIVIRTAFILLPMLVIIATVAGYFITKRAFRPVRQIQETAQQITRSNSLSSRIGLPEGRDEISQLANTIDEMLERLEQSFEKEKQFTSDASHELRTPISVILMESEYVLQDASTFEEARESMEAVNRQANRMSELINQLLFFAREENGTLAVNFEKTEILPVLQEIIGDCRPLAESFDISVEFTNHLKDGFACKVDRMLFSRAVHNLIQNAAVYGKQGGHIWVSVYVEGNYLVVSVKDDGIGISSEHLEKIWDRFYQVDESRSRAYAGSTGLGLSMVQKIMEKHNGYVKVESEEGSGSTFWLYFEI